MYDDVTQAGKSESWQSTTPPLTNVFSSTGGQVRELSTTPPLTNVFSSTGGQVRELAEYYASSY